MSPVQFFISSNSGKLPVFDYKAFLIRD